MTPLKGPHHCADAPGASYRMVAKNLLTISFCILSSCGSSSSLALRPTTRSAKRTNGRTSHALTGFAVRVGNTPSSSSSTGDSGCCLSSRKIVPLHASAPVRGQGRGPSPAFCALERHRAPTFRAHLEMPTTTAEIAPTMSGQQQRSVWTPRRVVSIASFEMRCRPETLALYDEALAELADALQSRRRV